MGNALFINTLFSFSLIETIFSWARQIFGATEQKLSEHAAQRAEFKKEQAADKTELKKKMQPRWLIFEPYY